MTIVFYSSNTNKFDSNTFLYTYKPSCKLAWEAVAQKYPKIRFVLIAQLPSVLLLDSNCATAPTIDGVDLQILPATATISNFVEAIKKQAPDIAVSASYWQNPFDWLPINDSIIAEKLSVFGISTLSHSAQTAYTCMNKWFTHQELQKKGFVVPKALYFEWELFFAERRVPIIEQNAYKEYFLNSLSKLKFPVVIKDISGVSSYGMDVARTFDEAVHFIKSKRSNCNKIIEEYVSGTQFGVEIFSTQKKHFFTMPFIFSVNKYGLTSPKQSVKIGPLTKTPKITLLQNLQLKRMLKKLAKNFDFKGVTQVDLVLQNNKWHIIEINPRLSGMTASNATAVGLSVPELLTKLALGTLSKNDFKKTKTVCNLKFNLQPPENLAKLSDSKNVLYFCQVENKAAKQIRESGYLEVVFELHKFPHIQQEFASFVDQETIDNAKSLQNNSLVIASRP